MLAPVILHIDARLDELGSLSPSALRERIAMEGDQPDRTRPHREVGLLRTLEIAQDLHGWSLSVDPRGIRVSHKERGVVLGLPTVVYEYLA